MWRGCGTDTTHKYYHLCTYYRPLQVSSQPFSWRLVQWAFPTIWSWVSVNAMRVCAKQHYRFGTVLVCMPWVHILSVVWFVFGFEQTCPALELFEVNGCSGGSYWLRGLRIGHKISEGNGMCGGIIAFRSDVGRMCVRTLSRYFFVDFTRHQRCSEWNWLLWNSRDFLAPIHTRRYWDLDRQGGCENILEGLIGLMTMMERWNRMSYWGGSGA